MTDIDVNAVRDALSHHETMVEYYHKAEVKERQNEVLAAAGLPTISGTLAGWDAKQRERHQKMAAAMRAVLTLCGDQAEAA